MAESKPQSQSGDVTREQVAQRLEQGRRAPVRVLTVMLREPGDLPGLGTPLSLQHDSHVSVAHRLTMELSGNTAVVVRYVADLPERGGGERKERAMCALIPLSNCKSVLIDPESRP